MTHEELRDRLLDLACGELSPRDAREVEEHAASCAPCRAELAALRGTRRVMAALPVEPAPERGERVLVAAAREAVRARAAKRGWPRWLWAAPVVAASLAAVVAVSVRVGAPPPPSAAHEDPDALRGDGAVAGAPIAPAARPAAGAAAGEAPAVAAAREPRAVGEAPEPRAAEAGGGGERRPAKRLAAAPRSRAAREEAQAPFAAPPPAAPAAGPAAAAADAAPAAAAAGATAATARAGAAAAAPAPARPEPAQLEAAAGARREVAPARRMKALAAPQAVSEAGSPRERAIAAALARAARLGLDAAALTADAGTGPLTFEEWRALHPAPGPAAAPAALAGRRCWAVELRVAGEPRAALTVFVEDGAFRALAEVDGR